MPSSRLPSGRLRRGGAIVSTPAGGVSLRNMCCVARPPLLLPSGRLRWPQHLDRRQRSRHRQHRTGHQHFGGRMRRRLDSGGNGWRRLCCCCCHRRARSASGLYGAAAHERHVSQAGGHEHRRSRCACDGGLVTGSRGSGGSAEAGISIGSGKRVSTGPSIAVASSLCSSINVDLRSSAATRTACNKWQNGESSRACIERRSHDASTRPLLALIAAGRLGAVVSKPADSSCCELG